MGDAIRKEQFDKLNLRTEPKGDKVDIVYNMEGVPKTGMYVIRFWPHKRHIGAYADFPIGMVEKGKGGQGRFTWSPDITKKTTFNFNLDLDVFTDEEAFRKGMSDAHIGQVDRGGEVTVDPPKATPPSKINAIASVKKECHQLLDPADGAIIKSVEVSEGEPAFGTHPRNTRVIPGGCK